MEGLMASQVNVNDPQKVARWHTLLKQIGGLPDNGAKVLALQQYLEGELPSKYACLISAYVGGAVQDKSRSLTDVRQSAEEYCGTEGGWFGIGGTTVEDAFEEAAERLPGEAYHTIHGWGVHKEAVSTAQMEANHRQEMQRIYDKVTPNIPAATFSLTTVLGALAVGYFVLVAVPRSKRRVQELRDR